MVLCVQTYAQLWLAHYTKGEKALERVQKKFIRILLELENTRKDWKNRLFSLEQQKLRGDLIEV